MILYFPGENVRKICWALVMEFYIFQCTFFLAITNKWISFKLNDSPLKYRNFLWNKGIVWSVDLGMCVFMPRHVTVLTTSNTRTNKQTIHKTWHVCIFNYIKCVCNNCTEELCCLWTGMFIYFDMLLVPIWLWTLKVLHRSGDSRKSNRVMLYWACSVISKYIFNCRNYTFASLLNTWPFNYQLISADQLKICQWQIMNA